MKPVSGRRFVATIPLYRTLLRGNPPRHRSTLLPSATPSGEPVWDALGKGRLHPNYGSVSPSASVRTGGRDQRRTRSSLRLPPDNMGVALGGVHRVRLRDRRRGGLHPYHEARTPLIISGEPEVACGTYDDLCAGVKTLEGRHSEGLTPKERRDRAVGCRLHRRREAKTVSFPAVALRPGERARGRKPLHPRNVQLRQPPDQALPEGQALYTATILRRP